MDKLTEEVARAIWLEASICPNKEATWMTMLDIDREPYVRYATAAIEAMRASSASSEARLREALERVLLSFDNVLGELEAHQANTGEFLEPEDQAVVRGAKADAEFARAALSNEGSG